MHPEDCSQFSIPRFQKLIGNYFSNFSIKKEKTVSTFFTQMVSYDSKCTNLGYLFNVTRLFDLILSNLLQAIRFLIISLTQR